MSVTAFVTMKTGDSGASGQRCEPDEGVLELHFFFFFFFFFSIIQNQEIKTAILKSVRIHPLNSTEGRLLPYLYVIRERRRKKVEKKK